MGVVLVVAAVLLAGACVALAAAHLRDVRRAQPMGLDEARAALRRAPREARAAKLAEIAPPASWLAELGRALSDGGSREARAAAVNDVLGDVARSLDATAAWPSVAVRLSAFGGLLVVVVAVLSRAGVVVVGVDATVAVAAALVAVRLGSVARAETAALRAAVDDLVGLCVSPGERAEPTERASRRGRRAPRR